MTTSYLYRVWHKHPLSFLPIVKSDRHGPVGYLPVPRSQVYFRLENVICFRKQGQHWTSRKFQLETCQIRYQTGGILDVYFGHLIIRFSIQIRFGAQIRLSHTWETKLTFAGKVELSIGIKVLQVKPALNLTSFPPTNETKLTWLGKLSKASEQEFCWLLISKIQSDFHPTPIQVLSLIFFYKRAKLTLLKKLTKYWSREFLDFILIGKSNQFPIQLRFGPQI